MDDFNRKRHAVYKLTYHAVFVIKYRRKVMSEPIIEHMRQYAAHLIDLDSSIQITSIVNQLMVAIFF